MDSTTSPLRLIAEPGAGVWLLSLTNGQNTAQSFSINVAMHPFGYELSREWTNVQFHVTGGPPVSGTDAIDASGTLEAYGSIHFAVTSVIDPDAKAFTVKATAALGSDDYTETISLIDPIGTTALNPANVNTAFFGTDEPLDAQVCDALTNGKWTLKWLIDNIAGLAGASSLVPDGITIKEIAGYLTGDLSAMVSNGLGSVVPADTDDATTLLGFNQSDGSINLHWAKNTGRLPPTGTGADGVRIQAALDDKGWVELKNGTYLDVAASVPLRGLVSGTGMNTILRPGAAQSAAVISVLDQAWGVTLADFSIDGWTADGSFAAAANGVYFNSGSTPLAYPASRGDNGPYLQNIRVNYMTGDGFSFIDPTGGLCLVGIHAQGLNAYQCNYGYVITGATDSNWMGLVAADNRRNGFKLLSANSRWSNCKSYFSGDSGSAADKADGRGYGWFLDYVHCDQFTNCEAQDSMHHGWYIRQCGFLQFHGAVADGDGYNNTVTPDGAAGFYLTNQLDGPLLLNGVGRNFRAVKSQDYHIYAESGITTRIAGTILVDTLSGMVGAANIGGPGAASIAYNSGTGNGIRVL